jgi:hypothetical protein
MLRRALFPDPSLIDKETEALVLASFTSSTPWSTRIEAVEIVANELEFENPNEDANP